MEPYFEEVYDSSVVSFTSPKGAYIGMIAEHPTSKLWCGTWNMVPRLDDNRYQFANKEEAIDYLKRVYYKQFSIGR